jgi:hypothetical protein
MEVTMPTPVITTRRNPMVLFTDMYQTSPTTKTRMSPE